MVEDPNKTLQREPKTFDEGNVHLLIQKVKTISNADELWLYIGLSFHFPPSILADL